MKKNIDIVGQNTQQDEQSSHNQPVQIPEKPKKKFWMISIILIAAICIFGGLYFYGILNDQFSNDKQKTSMVSPSEPPFLLSNGNQDLEDYDGKFLSFSYPTTWHAWSDGRGISLDYFQLNSVSQTEMLSPNVVTIQFDVQIPGYTDGQTLEEQKQRIEDFQKEYLDKKYIISERKIDGLDALEYEIISTDSPSYEKTVWARKNNVKYIITMTASGETPETVDLLVNQYDQEFENILNSIKLKNVDSSEVEELENFSG